MRSHDNTTRRVVRTGVGALGGLLGGFGAALVLTQSGRADVDWASGLSLASILVGATVGFVEPPAWAMRLMTAVVIVGVVAVGYAGFGSPASAQASCALFVTVDGQQHDLGATTREDPLQLDLGEEPTIEFFAEAPGVARGLVEVRAAGVTGPLGSFLEAGDPLLYRDEVDDGTAAGVVRVVRDGWTGFRLDGDRRQTPLLPVGLVELWVRFTDFATDGAVPGCPESVWVRVVARPIANPWGQAGLAATVVGALCLLVAGPLRRVVGLEPVEPSGRPVPYVDHGPIPADGPHLAHTESRILDEEGQQVDPSSPLLAGREYRLEITFGAGLRTVDRPADRAELTVTASSRSIALEHPVELGLAGAPFTIPFTPRRTGRHRISIDATRHGHHVQTERIAFSAVGADGVGASAPQTTRTLISTAIPSADELERLPERRVLVVLEADDDHTVDVRILDHRGEFVVHYDSPLPAQALDEAAGRLRAELQASLAGGPGSVLTVSAADLAAVFGPVVAAGQALAIALFPDTTVTAGDAAALIGLVGDGACVQVVGNGAGLGHATLPWGLIYDHPFIRRASGNEVCSSFAEHPVDACPHRDDYRVWCPTGFWGYRAVIEELWATTEEALLAPPTATDRDRAMAGSGGPSVVAYLRPDLAATASLARVFDRLGAHRIDDFDALCEWLGEPAPDLELLYFYTHHDEVAGEPGLLIGEDVLTAGVLNALRHRAVDRWPRRPLVLVNGCASGAYESTDPVSLVFELRAYGAVGVVAAECTLWDPLAGEIGIRMLEPLAAGRAIGPTLLALRRDLLTRHRNPIGLAYRLEASAGSTVRAAGPVTTTTSEAR